MGNAVISGILFQPPSPLNPLDYSLEGPVDCCDNAKNSRGDASSAASSTAIAKQQRNTISATYLWLQSQSEYTGEWMLIPAIHITHDKSENEQGGSTSAGGGGSGSIRSVSQRYTLLYSHGNAEDLGLISRFLVDLARLLQVDILCYDYSGYGHSASSASAGEFYVEFGREVDLWKSWRIGRDDDDETVRAVRSKSGRRCVFSVGVFSAPLLHTGASSSGGGNATKIGTPEAEQKRREEELLERHSWTLPASSENSCYANIRCAYDYLTRVVGVPPQRVILYGKSVGSGPTCWLAQRLCQYGCEAGRGTRFYDDDVMCGVGRRADGDASSHSWNAMDEMCSIDVEGREPRETVRGDDKAMQHRPGGVVLHSPFLSVIRVVLDVGFTTIWDLFPNFDRVGDFTCPVYVIHGSNDNIVPFYHGQTLFQMLPDPSKTVPFWAQGAGHNNIEMDMPTAYIKRLQQFIRQCDRVNFPGQLSPRKKQKQQEILQQSQNGRNYHLLMTGVGGASSSPAIIQSGGVNLPVKSSKQRKQKGTLVMKSLPSHKHMMPRAPKPSISLYQPFSSKSSQSYSVSQYAGSSVARNNDFSGKQLQQQELSVLTAPPNNSTSARYYRSVSASAAMFPSQAHRSQWQPSTQSGSVFSAE